LYRKSAVPADHEHGGPHVPVVDDALVEPQADLGRQRQLQPGVLEDVDEAGHHADEQDEEGHEQKRHHDDRVGHGRLDVGFDLVLVLDHVDEPIQDFGQRAARLAGLEHAAVKRREHLRVAAKGLVQAGAVADVLVDGGQDGPQLRVLGLLLEHLQDGEHRDTRADERSELLGEEDQLRGFDGRHPPGKRGHAQLGGAAAGRAHLGGDDPAVGERHGGGLGGLGLNVAADGVAGFVDGLVFERRHECSRSHEDGGGRLFQTGDALAGFFEGVVPQGDEAAGVDGGAVDFVRRAAPQDHVPDHVVDDQHLEDARAAR
jgi:hypothetical protein